MADRSAAGIFGLVMRELAEDPSEEHRGIAGRLYAQARQYDFAWEQAGCDGALVRLGLATLDEATRVVTYA